MTTKKVGLLFSFLSIFIFSSCILQTNNEIQDPTTVYNVTYHYKYNNSEKTVSINQGIRLKEDNTFIKGEKEENIYEFLGWYSSPLYTPNSFIKDSYIVYTNIDLYSKITMCMNKAYEEEGNKVVVETPYFSNSLGSELCSYLTLYCFDKDQKQIAINNVQSSYIEEGNKGKVIFTYESLERNEKSRSFLISNGISTITTPLTNVTLTPPTNVKVSGGEYGIFDISWDKKPDNVTYGILLKEKNNILDRGQHLSVKDNNINLPLISTKDCTIEMRSEILGVDGSVICYSPYTKSSDLLFKKVDTDVLVLMYMDADNNLDANIWEDFNEVEVGLEKIKDNSTKVEVVTLIDRFNAPSFLYKMGSDSVVNEELSKEALDLTLTANFIAYYDKNGKVQKEVSMSDIDTVTHFYDWAIEHYNITKDTKIILQFSNHGGGPRSLSLDERLMCQDDKKVNYTDPNYLLTKDVPIAIRKTFSNMLKTNRKVDLVIQDVCLGGNIEEVYEYYGCADYMLLSPNEVPASGHNYISLIGRLKDGECIKNNTLDIEDYLKKAVYDYQMDHRRYRSCTLSSYNVNEAKKLGDSFIDLVNNVLIKDNNKVTIKYDDGSVANYKYIPYVRENVFRDIYQNGYPSVGGQLYDIGEIIDGIENVNNINHDTTYKNAITSSIKKIREALDKTIISSWKQGVVYPTYEKGINIENKEVKNREGIATNNSYGLSILGLTFDKDKMGNPANSFRASSYYPYELAFGKNGNKWPVFMDKIVECGQ